MSFNTTRFVQTVKWTEATRLHHSIQTTAILAVLIFLITLMAPYGDLIDDSIRAIVGTVTVALTFFFIGVGTQFAQDMRLQQNRLFAMMLPASTQEKYLARLLHVTLGTFISTVVAVAAADALSMAYRLVTEGHLPTSLTWAILDDAFSILSNMNGIDQSFAILTVVLMVGFGHAFCVLGGVFFRRATLPLTALVAFLLLLFFSFTSVDLLVHNMVYIPFDTDYVIDVYSLYAGFDIFLIVLILACHFLAYHLFRRMQLINNKWINV